MKTSDILINHLISFMDKQEHCCCGIQDLESYFIYANKVLLLNSCLPPNFTIEGRRATECPLSWSEYADTVDSYNTIIKKSNKSIFSVFIKKAGKEEALQSFLVKKFPYYNQNEIAGIITQGVKISPIFLSKYFFKQLTTPSLLTNHPPNNLFTTEELNVLFFAMKLMSNQEIALRLGIYSCIVEQIIQQIYKKIDIYTRKQLRDYGIAEGFDNYFPPCLLKGLL